MFALGIERALAPWTGAFVCVSEAERRIGFDLILPPLDRRPARAYVIGYSIATVLLRSHGRTVLLSEFPSFGEDALKKLAVKGTVIEPVDVRGKPGLWIEGGPHVLTWMDRETGYRERPILVKGNVLLWLRGGRTLRLEARLSKPEALELARSIR